MRTEPTPTTDEARHQEVTVLRQQVAALEAALIQAAERESKLLLENGRLKWAAVRSGTASSAARD